MRWIGLLGVAAVMSCAPVKWSTIDLSSLPTAKQHPDADAVVLLDSRTVSYFEERGQLKGRDVHHKRVKVLRPGGQSRARIAAYYSKSFEQVVSARARVISATGEVTEIGHDEMSDLPATSSSILYDDGRVLTYEVEGLAVGSVVEWVVEVQLNRPNLVLRRFWFGGRVPTVEARFEVTTPMNWKVDHVAAQYWREIEFAPKMTVADGQRTLSFRKMNVPAVVSEPYGPGLLDAAPVVAVRLLRWTENGKAKTGFSDMAAYAKWMHDLQSGTSAPNDAIKAQVAEILKDVPDDPRQKAQRLYEWVQANIRYVAVEVGLGGWRPHTAQEIFEAGYGDCKDKANLLKTMLTAAGIDSHLASIYAHGGYPHRFLMPIIGNTNHAILAIDLPEGVMLADPTTRTVPFGMLPDSDQETEVLLIRAEGGRLMKTPSVSAEHNHRDIELDLELTKTGAIRGRFELAAQGRWVAYVEQAALGGTKDLEKLSRRWLGLSVKTVKHRARGAGLHLEGKVRHAGSKRKGGLMMKPASWGPSPVPRLGTGPRTTPVVLRSRHTRRTRTKLVLPAGAKLSTLPAAERIESELGRYQLRFVLEGGTLEIEERFELKERIVPLEKYDAFRRFCDAVETARARGFVVRGLKAR